MCGVSVLPGAWHLPGAKQRQWVPAPACSELRPPRAAKPLQEFLYPGITKQTLLLSTPPFPLPLLISIPALGDSCSFFSFPICVLGC